ncbi:MAG: uridine kinase [Defluviitaleaceae bacterium]|nr:uridine kinase [Defluviitaleaceae bacterium]MCL2262242.1 uridine kinase [Defluviitaleaceae bacterium]
MLVISIDGRAAAGKTTLAARFVNEYNASVIHMDDFFLPPSLRSQARLEEAGGNIHYERFAEEILPYIHDPAPFSYNIFDCAISDFNGKREISSAPVRVVEGSYSHHPILGNYADLRIFCDISPALQLERIAARNGEAAAKVFAKKWIPLEEAYFNFFGIADKADIVAPAENPLC